MAAAFIRRGARSVGKIGRKRQGGTTGRYVNRKGNPMSPTQIRKSGQRRMMGAGAGVGMLAMGGGGGSGGGGGRSSATRGITPRSSGGRTL